MIFPPWQVVDAAQPELQGRTVETSVPFGRFWLVEAVGGGLTVAGLLFYGVRGLLTDGPSFGGVVLLALSLLLFEMVVRALRSRGVGYAYTLSPDGLIRSRHGRSQIIARDEISRVNVTDRGGESVVSFGFERGLPLQIRAPSSWGREAGLWFDDTAGRSRQETQESP